MIDFNYVILKLPTVAGLAVLHSFAFAFSGNNYCMVSYTMIESWGDLSALQETGNFFTKAEVTILEPRGPGK